LRFHRVLSHKDLSRGYKSAPAERVALYPMSEREEPDLDQVRDAMRDHDERLREEHADDEAPDQGDEGAGDDEDESDT
jgi:hypothetical protein